MGKIKIGFNHKGLNNILEMFRATAGGAEMIKKSFGVDIKTALKIYNRQLNLVDVENGTNAVFK